MAKTTRKNSKSRNTPAASPRPVDRHRQNARALRKFTFHLPFSDQEEALSRLADADLRRLQRTVSASADERAAAEDARPGNWDDERHDLAATILQKAAVMNFVLLKASDRARLIRQTAMLRQSSPSVACDAEALADEIRDAVRMTYVDYGRALTEQGGTIEPPR